MNNLNILDRSGNIHGHQTPIIQNNNDLNGYHRGAKYISKGPNILSNGYNRLEQSRDNDK